MLVYLAAMLVIGIPLLTMEIAIGRKVRGGAPKAMHSIKKNLSQSAGLQPQMHS